MSKWYDDILKKASTVTPNDETPEQIIQRQADFLAQEQQIADEALYAIPWVVSAVLGALLAMSLFGVT